MYREYKIGIVVPAYKEELLIGRTLDSIPDYVDRIYVVDDASPDNTGEIAKVYAEKDSRIITLHHLSNGGVGAAISTGYQAAMKDQMDIIAVMAGDNQMDPRYLQALLDPIVDGGVDYTKGNRLCTREDRNGMSRWRTFGNILLTYLTKFASGYYGLMDPQNGYTAISRKALECCDISTLYPKYGYCNQILVRLNVHKFNVMDVQTPARYGTEKSKIKYHTYIPKVSFLLLTSFIWRLKEKYIIPHFHPFVLFYLLGIPAIFIGTFGLFVELFFKFILIGEISKYHHPFLILVSGAVFLGIGILFDMHINKTKVFSSIYGENVHQKPLKSSSLKDKNKILKNQ